jgi:hypothetical protein
VNDSQSNTSFSDIYTSLQPLQKDWYAVLGKSLAQNCTPGLTSSVAGNHDVRGSVQAQLKLHATEPHWNMPQRYYSKEFEANGVSVLWLFVDTTLMLNGSFERE